MNIHQNEETIRIVPQWGTTIPKLHQSCEKFTPVGIYRCSAQDYDTEICEISERLKQSVVNAFYVLTYPIPTASTFTELLLINMMHRREQL